MAKAVKKIVFSHSRNIPFNKLVLSASNVRRIRPDHNIEELAEDIARREDLVQGLNVRPVLDADGYETGMFEVPAGGRRYATRFLTAFSRPTLLKWPANVSEITANGRKILFGFMARCLI